MDSLLITSIASTHSNRIQEVEVGHWYCSGHEDERLTISFCDQVGAWVTTSSTPSLCDCDESELSLHQLKKSMVVRI